MNWAHAALATQAFYCIPKMIFFYFCTDDKWSTQKTVKDIATGTDNWYDKHRGSVWKTSFFRVAFTYFPWNVASIFHICLCLYIRDSTYLTDAICSGIAIKWLTHNFPQILPTRWLYSMPARLMLVIWEITPVTCSAAFICRAFGGCNPRILTLCRTWVSQHTYISLSSFKGSLWSHI